ncbi:hypothetical protein Tco_0517667 [Tanacetum coccineum]
MQLMFIQMNCVLRTRDMDLMDANKKVDLKHVQCPPESKILTNIIKNHPFSIQNAAFFIRGLMDLLWHSSGILWKEDRSKVGFRFKQDKEKNHSYHWMTFRQFFHLHKANANNHMHSVATTIIFRTFGFILQARRHKNKVGMKIPDWMITDEMKQRALSDEKTSAPRSSNPDKEVAESSVLSRSTVIHFRLPERRSTRLTPPAPRAVALVDEHLASEEIENMVEKQENIVDDISIPRNDESNILGTRIELQSDKESPEVEIAKEKEVEITQETEVEIIRETQRGQNLTSSIDTRGFFYELQGHYGYLFAHLRARFMPKKSFDTLTDNLHDVMVETLPTIVDKHVKKQVMQQVLEQVRNQVPVYIAEGLILERQKVKEETERLIDQAILQEHGNIQAQISTQIENAIANVIPSQVDASVRNYMSGHILHLDIAIWLALQYEVLKELTRNQEQDDDFDFWTDSYALDDDDEIPTKQVSQDIMEEVLLTIDEPKLRKMADEMLRQDVLQEMSIRIEVELDLCHPSSMSYALEIILQDNLPKYETEELKFEKEIEERLKHRRQMRRWEMYVNGRPLGLRRERPE